MSALELQNVIARQGLPFEISVELDGDQSGSTIEFTVAPRWAALDAVPVTVSMTPAAPVTSNGATTTVASGVLDAAVLEDFVPGTVYTYDIIVNNGNPAATGTFEVARRWS